MWENTSRTAGDEEITVSKTPAANRLRNLFPAIMQQWDDRVRAEVPAAMDQGKTVLHDTLTQMLEVLAKVLAHQTDPRTAARDLAFITKHGGGRAGLVVYSLEQMILECQILQEVVLDVLEPEEPLDHRDRSIVLVYLGEVVRVAAGEYARVQDQVREDYARKLELADRAKDEFLAMLGHELRNPLGAISNSIYVVRQTAGEGRISERALEVAHRQVQAMTEMVNQLLDVARISEGLITLHKEPLEIGAVVGQAVDAVPYLMDAKGHTLSVALNDSPLYVEVDRVRFSQVVTNLLSNAAKYTPPGGRIEVAVERDGDQAVVRVRDNGVGMEPGLVPHVFDLFRQAPFRATDRTEGGLGIGLTVARRLIEMHGGTVAAYSGGLGQGSEFTVRLPVLLNVPQEAREGERSSYGGASGLRILLVEDNPDAAAMMGEILELWGHMVVTVGDGPAALEALGAHLPHVVLLDIGLPGLDGYAVAHRLRAHEAGRRVKLVALTGYQNSGKIKAAGFDTYLSKPVDLERLRQFLAATAREVTP